MATVRSLDEIAQFKSSFKEFYEEINSGNVERFYPSDENKSTLARAIDATNLPWAEKWIKPLWHWAYSSNLSKLEARPSEVPPEKKEEDRQYINGKFNHAWKPDVVENPNPKNPALEFLNDLRDALNKPSAPKVEEDTPFRVHARGLPDASLPDNDPAVQSWLRKMKADSSPESLKSLKTYLQSRATYKMTHLEFEQ
jgi:hypothetical protein